jgi:hypothetical protein
MHEMYRASDSLERIGRKPYQMLDVIDGSDIALST